MGSSVWIVLIAVVVVTLLVWRLLRTRRLTASRNEQLTERQVAIQTALDRAGAVLKDENSTTEAGNIAADQVLAELRALNQDGSLEELIADTEQFIAEWRAARAPA